MNLIQKIVLTFVVMLTVASNTTYAHNGQGCCGESHATPAPLPLPTGIPFGIEAVEALFIKYNKTVCNHQVQAKEITLQQTLGLIIVAGPAIAWWNDTGKAHISKGVDYLIACCSKKKTTRNPKKCCSHESENHIGCAH